MRFSVNPFKCKLSRILFQSLLICLYSFLTLSYIYCIFNHKNQEDNSQIDEKCININHYLRYECLEKYCGGWGMISFKIIIG